MLTALWRRVDRALPPAAQLGDLEQRARARLLTAFGLICAVFGAALAPIDAAFGPTHPAVSLSALAFGLLLLALLRAPRGIDLASHVLLVALAILGAGVQAFVPLPGDPYLAWLLLLGLTPVVSPALSLSGAVTLVAVVFALAVPSTPGPGAVVPPGDTIALAVILWFAMHLMLEVHALALSEHADATAAQLDLTRELDDATAALEAEAHETLSFLTTLRHELRTPLNGVLGLGDLLAAEALPEGPRRDLVEIHGAGRSMLRILDTLLVLTRSTATGREPPEPVDVPGVIDATLAALAREFELPARACDFALAPGTPRVLVADRELLAVVLAQALGAAFDAGAKRASLTGRLDGAAFELRAQLPVSGGPTAEAPADETARVPFPLALAVATELATVVPGGGLVAEADAFTLTLVARWPVSVPASQFEQ